jgi:hypothetical protein
MRHYSRENIVVFLVSLEDIFMEKYQYFRINTHINEK